MDARDSRARLCRRGASYTHKEDRGSIDHSRGKRTRNTIPLDPWVEIDVSEAGAARLEQCSLARKLTQPCRVKRERRELYTSSELPNSLDRWGGAGACCGGGERGSGPGGSGGDENASPTERWEGLRDREGTREEREEQHAKGERNERKPIGNNQNIISCYFSCALLRWVEK